MAPHRGGAEPLPPPASRPAPLHHRRGERRLSERHHDPPGRNHRPRRVRSPDRRPGPSGGHGRTQPPRLAAPGAGRPCARPHAGAEVRRAAAGWRLRGAPLVPAQSAPPRRGRRGRGHHPLRGGRDRVRVAAGAFRGDGGRGAAAGARGRARQRGPRRRQRRPARERGAAARGRGAAGLPAPPQRRAPAARGRGGDAGSGLPPARRAPGGGAGRLRRGRCRPGALGHPPRLERRPRPLHSRHVAHGRFRPRLRRRDEAGRNGGRLRHRPGPEDGRARRARRIRGHRRPRQPQRPAGQARPYGGDAVHPPPRAALGPRPRWR